jgi:GntR family transcriptional regulator / MocR family aminotransferase
MRRWVAPPDVRTRRSRRARWTKVASGVREGIASGRLAPGEWLPSVRELGVVFGVHRHTVEVAVDALVAEGLLETFPRRGVRVAAPPAMPERGRLHASSTFPRFRLVRGAEPRVEERLDPPPGAILLHAATPDVSLLPAAELRAAYSDALSRPSALPLGAVDARGLPGLRRELVRYLRRARGLVAEDVLLTHGSQEGIALAGEVLLAPGDAVGVESPGYLPALEAFRDLGAELVPLPVDEQGLNVDALAEVLSNRRLRLLYLTPNHQYPTTASLSTPRRAALLALTLRHGVPVLEDDYDHEYHYRGAPQAPLAAWRGAAHVVYLGTLSKLVGPGVRVGFAAGPTAVLDAMARRRALVTRGNDGVTQAAMTRFMAEGAFERHLRRVRRTYLARRDAALRVLERAQRRHPFVVREPDGGLAIWTEWPEDDVARLALRAVRRGVVVLPEPVLRLDGGGHGIRLAFGGVSEAAFEQGVARLLSAARGR